MDPIRAPRAAFSLALSAALLTTIGGASLAAEGDVLARVEPLDSCFVPTRRARTSRRRWIAATTWCRSHAAATPVGSSRSATRVAPGGDSADRTTGAPGLVHRGGGR
jgi:hypothetical protein